MKRIRSFGFSAKTTLSIAQALYERHKVLTYPRTDSRALPEDYVAIVRKTMDVAGRHGAVSRRSRRRLSSKDWVKPNKRVFDNAKVSDHFAIIPTLQTPKHLSEVEAKLYDLVVKRFLSIFFPAAEYLVTTRITEVEEHSVQDRRQGAGRAGLARDLRHAKRMRGAGIAAEDRSRANRSDRPTCSRWRCNASTRALHGSNVAVGDGGRGQADRRR